VLLAFWATSCGICRRELPLLNSMMTEMRGKGVEIVAIHVGDGEGAREYMRENHINLTSLSDPEGSAARAYRVGGIPKLVLIGADGMIQRTRVGGTTARTLREWAQSVATR
jgi:peroxiredoxin